jgi:hypothetical protein
MTTHDPIPARLAALKTTPTLEERRLASNSLWGVSH